MQLSGVPGAKRSKKTPAFAVMQTVRVADLQPMTTPARSTPSRPLPVTRPSSDTPVPSPTLNPSSSSSGPLRLAPSTNYTVRGTRPLPGTLSDTDRADMLNALQADTAAKTTAASRASCVRTWSYLHRLWFGDSTPTLPLTTSSICAVAAQMKSAGYRSFVNYLDTMKAIHVETSTGPPQWSSVANAA